MFAGVVGWISNGLWGNAKTDELVKVSNIHDEEIQKNRNQLNLVTQGLQDNSKSIHGLEKAQHLEGQIVQHEELLRKLNAHFDNMK